LMHCGSASPPALNVLSRLYYDQDLFTPQGFLTDATLALLRDINERKMLVDLARQAPPPVITFTDGQMELWGRMSDGMDATEYQKHLEEYLGVLEELCAMGAITAGYVDKPAANHVIRLLEIAFLSETQLPQVKDSFPLRGVKDYYLFQDWLAPGERSAVFRIQSRSASSYSGSLALHFFYLNVGRPGRPWLARVEAPAWVIQNRDKLDQLHAVLLDQCRIMGSRPYPYLLHRAHEVARVSLEEKGQLEQMIAIELQRRGVPFGEKSQKQAHKESAGRTRYKP
jgi:hypothetical protein